MTERINFSAVKQYFTTGEISEDFYKSGISIQEAQAIALRRQSRIEANEGDAEQSLLLRRQSKEALVTELPGLHPDLIHHVMTAATINYEEIAAYLKENGVTELPVLSNAPPELLDEVKKYITVRIIPADQVDVTDFDSILRDSEVPDWFREAKSQPGEKVHALDAVRRRWFLLLMLMLSVASVVGFQQGWGVEVADIVGQVDLFFSLYGIVTVSRSVWQINRAEKWNAHARDVIRTPYANALAELSRQDSIPNSPELEERADALVGKNTNWDDFKARFYDPDSSQKKASLIDEYIEASRQQGREVSKDQAIDRIGEHIIRETFGEEVPSVAFVVPTYQTKISEMRGLLLSAKDQVYPVNTVYVVYNDDPNDERKREQKQAEFMEYQQLVNEMNNLPGRNDCQIMLLAQPARGKREAMAMGFAHSLGRSYMDDLRAKHPDASDEQLSSFIGNLDIESLPDFRHDFTLNIDSDTRIADPFALLNSAIMMKHNPNAASTTGDVRVENRNFNMLSEMTFQRYWRAFFVERAAQSLSGEVTCMSGPWVFMRNEALASILDEWYFQEFMGVRSTYGDDRHLTTLFLKHGWDTLFTPDSAVLTDCPTDWKTFLKQQLRWNKSFNRENLLLFQFIYKMDKYVQFDTAFQQLFAFAMLSILGSITGNAVKTGIEQGAIEGLNTVIPYAVTVLFYNELFFGVYGALKNKDAKYLMSPTYIAYHFGGLLWLKIYALLKMKDASWGTKGELNEGQTKQLINDFEVEKSRLIEEIAGEIERKHAANPEQYSQDIGLDEMSLEEAAAFGHQISDAEVPNDDDDDDYGYGQMEGMENS